MQLLRFAAIFTAVLAGAQARDSPPPANEYQHVERYDRYHGQHHDRSDDRHQGIGVRIRVSGSSRSEHQHESYRGRSTAYTPPPPDQCCIPDGERRPEFDIQYPSDVYKYRNHGYDVERESKFDIQYPSDVYRYRQEPPPNYDTKGQTGYRGDEGYREKPYLPPDDGRSDNPGFYRPEDIPKTNAPVPAHLQGRPHLRDFMEAYEVTSYARMPKPEMVKDYIQGELSNPDIGDTCVVRVCSGFQGSDIVLPSWEESGKKLLTVVGGERVNHYRYALRVVELRDWLKNERGWQPFLSIEKKALDEFDFSQLDGRRGLIAIDWIENGHFGIYHGDRRPDRFSGTELKYFKFATQITFFELPSQ